MVSLHSLFLLRFFYDKILPLPDPSSVVLHRVVGSAVAVHHATQRRGPRLQRPCTGDIIQAPCSWNRARSLDER